MRHKGQAQGSSITLTQEASLLAGDIEGAATMFIKKHEDSQSKGQKWKIHQGLENLTRYANDLYRLGEELRSAARDLESNPDNKAAEARLMTCLRDIYKKIDEVREDKSEKVFGVKLGMFGLGGGGLKLHLPGTDKLNKMMMNIINMARPDIRIAVDLIHQADVNELSGKALGEKVPQRYGVEHLREGSQAVDAVLIACNARLDSKETIIKLIDAISAPQKQERKDESEERKPGL